MNSTSQPRESLNNFLTQLFVPCSSLEPRLSCSQLFVACSAKSGVYIASDEKLDESLGSRLCAPSFRLC